MCKSTQNIFFPSPQSALRLFSTTPPQAHRGEIERLNALLAEAPSKEDAAELEAEYQERLAYLERSLKEAVDERTSLQRAREEEHLAMKQVCLRQRFIPSMTHTHTLQALEETRKVTSSTDTLNMDNEVP